MCQLFSVTFHGDTIFCLDYQNQPYTPMRPIVENMGLDWSAQAAKFRANKERWTVVIITTVAQDGSEREMLCMPVRKLPAYLNSINPRKVRPELRAKIELYQAESDDALWNYWMHGRAERPVPQTAEAAITPDQQCTLQAIVRARVEGIPAERRSKGLYPQIWSRFNNHFRLGSYKQLPQYRMSEAVAYLTRMEIAPALPPQPERLPLYRNGAFYLPPANNPAHKPGPQEEALMALWKEWGSRTRELEQLFNSLSRDLDACRGKTFAYAISDLGRHADTAFGTDAILEGLHASQDTACDLFRQALHSMSRQLLLSLNVAVALGR